MDMEKVKGVTYAKLKRKDMEYVYDYYTVSKGDITFIRPRNQTQWIPPPWLQKFLVASHFRRVN